MLLSRCASAHPRAGRRDEKRMSGIVGIFERTGKPADRGLVEALTRFLAFRGPDARDSWTDGPIGLGHTMLRTTRESLNEKQPASLDGTVWIAADARIDCRSQLIEKMRQAGRAASAADNDSELILKAYSLWQSACVLHLCGDFAFAIWDASRKSLFCARDYFGVKPFYYAHHDGLFIFSNTLDCVRLHPDVSEDLNEAAVADFLLFGLNYDVHTTTFRDVQRLPAAHTLTVTSGALRIERYWSPPTSGRVRYKDPRHYAEHLNVLLQQAVADRLRTDNVGILMSGGIDSAAVAAHARDLSRHVETSCSLSAYTMVYESLFADQEGTYAKDLARFLQIPIQCIPLDELRPFEHWPRDEENSGRANQELSWPEPVDDTFFAGLFTQFRAISANCRVALTGDGSDNLMHFEMGPHARDLARSGNWFDFAVQVSRYLQLRGSIVPGIRRRVERFFGNDPVAAIFPNWLAPELVARLHLTERLKDQCAISTGAGHPILPKAHASLSLPQWSSLFELQDPGVTKCLVEMRHPFLDPRVVNFLLALPPFPLFLEKKLLRDALAGRVPESVRTRKKIPLAGDPLQQYLRRPDTNWISGVKWVKEMRQYVDTSRLEPLIAAETGKIASLNDLSRTNSTIRPICFNFWLQSMRRVRYNLHAEARNG
jgi:asparagine synthase (glutamine-hydrolysing)